MSTAPASSQQQQQTGHRPIKDVFVIEHDGDRDFWRQVGVAFVNKDGSLSLKLYMMPQLRMQIRDRSNTDHK